MSDARLSSRGAQRTIVFVALYLFAAVLVLWPYDRDGADAQAQSNSQQPFQCQQLGGSANPALANGPQSRRSVLPLARSGGDRGSGTMYPCISGVPWRFKVGNLASDNSNEVIMTADNVYAPGYNNLYFAANGDTPTEGNNGDVFQTSFAGMTICTGSGTPVGNCRLAANNLDSNANNDVLITANSAFTGAVCVPPAACGAPVAPKPASDYTLKFTPDGAATIGGGGVVTDVWAVAQSRFTVALSNIPLEACGIAGGSTAGDNPFFGSGTATCQNIPLWKLNSLDWIVGGSDYKIMGMDLTFFYMVTHANDPIDPYSPAGAPGGATNPLTSIKLPNTTVTVTTP